MFIVPIPTATSMYDHSAAQTAGDAAAAARKNETEIEFMKAHIERLLMISEALWTLLKETHGYTDEELYHRVAEIDLQDGKLDGKVARKPPEKCVNCHRTVYRKSMICLYCGTPVMKDVFER